MNLLLVDLATLYALFLALRLTFRGIDALPLEVVRFVPQLVGPDYLQRYYADAPPVEAELERDLQPGRARLRSHERRGGYVR